MPDPAVQTPLIAKERAAFHTALLAGELNCDDSGIPSIADRGSAISVGIAKAWITKLGVSVAKEKAAGQHAGMSFEHAVADFIEKTFLHLHHIRPGSWQVLRGSRKTSVRISNFVQYNHLLQLSEMARENPPLKAALGGDYLIEPDIVVARSSEAEAFLDPDSGLLNDDLSRLSPLRCKNHESESPVMLMHASISCKWTLRSDRAQNARTEALNLIRNRNGRVPHIVAITAEPTPKRIASIALGSSDLDCIYHVALPELRMAVAESLEGRRSEQLEDLDMLIRGSRLRDISDLPLDLAM